jgi:hypothetical protein
MLGITIMNKNVINIYRLDPHEAPTTRSPLYCSHHIWYARCFQTFM